MTRKKVSFYKEFLEMKRSCRKSDYKQKFRLQMSNWRDYAIVQRQKHFFRAIVRVY